MQTGLENKKQVYVLLSLTALLVAIALWEFHGGSSTQAAIARSSPLAGNSGPGRTRTTAETASGETSSEPQLRLAQAARAESTEYMAGGRNIFSVESEPVHIEPPLAPARPAEVAVISPPAPAPPPRIELKYLGYTRNVGDTVYKAVLANKDESLIAKAGDIVFHRYQVVSIQPSSIQITDLSYKNTQSLPIIEK